MPRTLDVATLGAISSRTAVIPRNFVSCTVKDGEGDPVVFAFTDFGENVTTNVIWPETGTGVSRDFFGDASPIVSMDAIPLKIGLEVDTIQIVLNHLHPAVETMIRGHDCRNARVDVWRGYLDPDSMLLAATPRPRFRGSINGAPILTGVVGGEGNVTLKVVSMTRVLTKTSTLLRSDESQRLRGGDRGRRYNGTAYRWPISWGGKREGE